MKFIKPAALALIVSNISAITLNTQNASVAIITESSLTSFKNGNGHIKTSKKAVNETVQDNGTLTQNDNATFSHTLAEANSTIIDNHTTINHAQDNGSESHNATVHDNATFVQLKSD